MAPANDSSQAEIWDDSALVNSWNEALEEYKHYHSIHARGERVGDILKQTSEAGTDGMNANAPAASAANREDDQAAIVMGKEGQVQTTVGNKDLGAPMAQEKQPEQVPGGPSNSTGSPSWKAPALPQHLIGQVHDEGLKNLLMSWYYAGYYTGLYEGQRKAA